MKGTIKIEMDKTRVSFDVNMENISKIGKLVLFDSMAHALELTDEEREVIGATITVGGIGKVVGVSPYQVKIDTETLRKFRQDLTSEEK